VRQAHRAGQWEPAWRLAHSLERCFAAQACWDDWQLTHLLALEAARRAGDPRGEAAIHGGLGHLFWQQRRVGEARASFQRCLAAYARLGDGRGADAALRRLGPPGADQVAAMLGR
jgi:hypothetical protein